ncbi:hypothetical protein PYCC9005_002303 [Savitreella phatthalungensis]
MLATFLLLASWLTGADAFFRMLCSKAITVARLDPIVSPGTASMHTHAIMGPSSFFDNVTYNDLRNADCSTCVATQDKSAYWVPQLYHVSQAGQYTAVGLVGGITVYYLQRGPPGPAGKILAVPNGLRMIAGDPFRRTQNNSDLTQSQIGWVCLGGAGYNGNFSTFGNCPNGLRQQIFFPNCWDGVNLDSPDHKSHMAYSGPDGNYACPASHPVKLVSLFYEVMWDVNAFKDQYWNGTTAPFVLAQGDPTGYGSHGDFMSGWDQNELQTAVDTCNNNSGRLEDCPALTLDWGKAASCNINSAQTIQENVLGPLNALPGCNPVSWGPEEAPMFPSVCPSGETPANAPVVAPKAATTTSATTSPTSQSTSIATTSKNAGGGIGAGIGISVAPINVGGVQLNGGGVVQSTTSTGQVALQTGAPVAGAPQYMTVTSMAGITTTITVNGVAQVTTSPQVQLFVLPASYSSMFTVTKTMDPAALPTNMVNAVTKTVMYTTTVQVAAPSDPAALAEMVEDAVESAIEQVMSSM